MLSLTVPGNLLLVGEYLVLDPGGPGLALAVEPRVLAHCEPAESWRLEARMGGETRRWIARPGSGPGAAEQPDGPLPLADAIFDLAPRVFAEFGLSMPEPQSVIIDSSPFFDAAGRKAGYGSSAASAVAMAMLVARLAAADTHAPDPALPLALAAHRAMQGGRGSGYDVYASYHGGFGLFSGGEEPLWQALPWPVYTDWRLYPGPDSVGSSGAVAKFQAVRQTMPGSVQAALDDMGLAITAFVLARLSLADCLCQAREAGIRLGTLIGVPAELPVADSPPGLCCKALGAGNELGILLHRPANPSREALPFWPPAGSRPLLPASGPEWLNA